MIYLCDIWPICSLSEEVEESNLLKDSILSEHPILQNFIPEVVTSPNIIYLAYTYITCIYISNVYILRCKVFKISSMNVGHTRMYIFPITSR